MEMGNRSVLFPIRNMLRRLYAYAKKVRHETIQYYQNGVLNGKKIIYKIHTHCAQHFARRVSVCKKCHTLVCKPCTVVSFNCTCELHLSYFY
jgi:hypothetical protein